MTASENLSDDELDALEMGTGGNYLSHERYLPVHSSRGWVRCNLTTLDDGCSFRMYLEGKRRNRLLFSARQLERGGPIYISTREDLALSPSASTLTNLVSKSLARLERLRDGSLALVLSQCHLCDHKLGLGTCGRGPEDREVILRAQFRLSRNHELGVNFRSLTVLLPSMMPVLPDLVSSLPALSQNRVRYNSGAPSNANVNHCSGRRRTSSNWSVNSEQHPPSPLSLDTRKRLDSVGTVISTNGSQFGSRNNIGEIEVGPNGSCPPWMASSLRIARDVRRAVWCPRSISNFRESSSEVGVIHDPWGPSPIPLQLPLSPSFSPSRQNLPSDTTDCSAFSVPGTPNSTTLSSPLPTYQRLQMDADVHSTLPYCSPYAVMRCRSAVPEFNSQMDGLVIRFTGDRILASSAKNFLLLGPSTSSLSSSSVDAAVQGMSSSLASALGTSPTKMRTNKASDVDGVPLPTGWVSSGMNSGRGQNSAKRSTALSTFSTEEDDCVGSYVDGSDIVPDDKKEKLTFHEDFSLSPLASGTSSPIIEGKRLPPADRHDLGSAASTLLSNFEDSLRPYVIPSEEGILQFGKASSTRFVLDFRYPLSPIQAFGLALATFLEEQSIDSESHRSVSQCPASSTAAAELKERRSRKTFSVPSTPCSNEKAVPPTNVGSPRIGRGALIARALSFAESEPPTPSRAVSSVAVDQDCPLNLYERMNPPPPFSLPV